MQVTKQYIPQGDRGTKKGVQIKQVIHLDNEVLHLEQKYQIGKMKYQNFYPLLIKVRQIIILGMK